MTANIGHYLGPRYDVDVELIGDLYDFLSHVGSKHSTKLDGGSQSSIVENSAWLRVVINVYASHGRFQYWPVPYFL